MARNNTHSHLFTTSQSCKDCNRVGTVDMLHTILNLSQSLVICTPYVWHPLFLDSPSISPPAYTYMHILIQKASGRPQMQQRQYCFMTKQLTAAK